MEQARAQACDYCEDEEEVKALLDELMSQPVKNIRFIDLARMWGVGQEFAETLWETIKAAGRDEFESGHLASNNLTLTQYHRTAWAIASYLGLRESFIAEWQPHGGIQLSLIDMLAQSFLQYQHWVNLEPPDLQSHLSDLFDLDERLADEKDNDATEVFRLKLVIRHCFEFLLSLDFQCSGQKT